MNIKALILYGEGINCELETARAFKLAGAQTIIMHVLDFLELESLNEFDILAFPGGFSFGDEIRSGKILAQKIKNKQIHNIKDFIQDNKPIIGICNGFQILTQLGVFDEDERVEITLSENEHGSFINKWATIEVMDQHNFWLQDLPNKIELPIRHKEGNLNWLNKKSPRIAFRYLHDQNGSSEQTAGILNTKGNILGLMPHPEAAINNLLLPNHLNKKDQENISLQIFKNAVNHCKGLRHAD